MNAFFALLALSLASSQAANKQAPLAPQVEKPAVVPALPAARVDAAPAAVPAAKTEVPAASAQLQGAVAGVEAGKPVLGAAYDGGASAAAGPTLDELVPAGVSYLSAGEATRVAQTLGLSKDQLLDKLVEKAKAFARPGISGPKYAVGAAALGESGAVYLAGNIEFAGMPYNQAIHGEQAVTMHALLRGETGLEAVALSALPCGHCRQFLNELVSRGHLRVLVRGESPESLANLLPKPYGTKGTLLQPRLSNNLLPPSSADTVVEAAFRTAETTYSSYDPSAVAIKTKDGRIFTGGHVQVAGANPSVSPLQAALVAMAVAGADYADIDRVVLLETRTTKVSEQVITRLLLQNIAPQAPLRVVIVDKKPKP